MNQFRLKDIQKLVERLLHIEQLRKYSHGNRKERLRLTLSVNPTPVKAPCNQEEPPALSLSLRNEGFGPNIWCSDFYGYCPRHWFCIHLYL